MNQPGSSLEPAVGLGGRSGDMADSSTPFIRNAWYVVAPSSEVSRTPLGRTVLGTSVVVFRKQDGSVVALQNRCCHRSFPLSHGTVDGDTIVCGYHGLRYDATRQMHRDPDAEDRAGRRCACVPTPLSSSRPSSGSGWAWSRRRTHERPPQPPVARGPGLGRALGLPVRQGQLCAHAREPARPLAPELPARTHVRHARVRAHAGRDALRGRQARGLAARAMRAPGDLCAAARLDRRARAYAARARDTSRRVCT